jgi:hypothetical protein
MVGLSTGDRRATRAGGFTNPFMDFSVRRVARAWSARECQDDIPWAALARPLSAARIALVTSAGVARTDDRPFDQAIEQRDPWWSDQSYRVIPDGTTKEQIRLYHLHINCHYGEQDLDVVLPLRRLHELQGHGLVGAVAPSHYSFMGYVLQPRDLVHVTAEEIARRMHAEQVDAAVLVPV